jgi:hypothetical protein
MQTTLQKTKMNLWRKARVDLSPCIFLTSILKQVIIFTGFKNCFTLHYFSWPLELCILFPLAPASSFCTESWELSSGCPSVDRAQHPRPRTGWRVRCFMRRPGISPYTCRAKPQEQKSSISTPTPNDPQVNHTAERLRAWAKAGRREAGFTHQPEW